MNVIERAQQAYAPTSSPVRTGRGTELQLFSQTTARLKAANRQPADIARMADAIHQNRRVWTHMAGDVADQANDLPPELRARLFYLSEFVTQHSRKVLRGMADASALIEVNTAIMRGLSGIGQD